MPNELLLRKSPTRSDYLPPTPPTPTYGGEIGRNSSNSNGTSVTCPVTNAVPAGSFVYLFVGGSSNFASANGTAITSKGDSVTLVSQSQRNANDMIGDYAGMITTALVPGDSIVVTYGDGFVSAARAVIGIWFTGIAYGDDYVSAGAGGGAGSASVASNTLQGVEVPVIACAGLTIGTTSSNVWTPTGGWTLVGSNIRVGLFDVQVAYQVLAPNTQISTAGSFSRSSSHYGFVVHGFRVRG